MVIVFPEIVAGPDFTDTVTDKPLLAAGVVVVMVKDGYLKSRHRTRLLDELLSLKYMEHLSPFVRRLALGFHKSLSVSPLLRVAETTPGYRAKRRT